MATLVTATPGHWRLSLTHSFVRCDHPHLPLIGAPILSGFIEFLTNKLLKILGPVWIIEFLRNQILLKSNRAIFCSQLIYDPNSYWSREGQISLQSEGSSLEAWARF
jgi:hypothetical protein